MRDYHRLDQFLDQLAGDIYPETPTQTHREVTEEVIDALVAQGLLRKGMNVLDVGCGQGVALRLFAGHGAFPVGLGLGPDVQVCRDKGFLVVERDQSFLAFGSQVFDLIFARHVLEHSIFPFFTLTEFHRALKPGGGLYVEVPAPDSICDHEANPNHYSVMGGKMWQALFKRAGFTLVNACHLDVEVPAGPDRYLGFLLKAGAQVAEVAGSNPAVAASAAA